MYTLQGDDLSIETIRCSLCHSAIFFIRREGPKVAIAIYGWEWLYICGNPTIELYVVEALLPGTFKKDHFLSMIANLASLTTHLDTLLTTVYRGITSFGMAIDKNTTNIQNHDRQ